MPVPTRRRSLLAETDGGGVGLKRRTLRDGVSAAKEVPPRADESTGDTYCKATNVTYRLDTESARRFLGQYVALP